MIPTTKEEDLERIKKTFFIITRGMTAKNKTDDNSKLNIWKCTSTNNLKETRTLKFKIGSGIRNIIIKNDNNLNHTSVRRGDDPDHRGEVLAKLSSKLNKLNFKNYFLSVNDKIFKYINVVEMTENKEQPRQNIVVQRKINNWK